MRLDITQDHIDAAVEWASEQGEVDDYCGDCIIAQALRGAGYLNPDVHMTFAYGTDPKTGVRHEWNLDFKAQAIADKDHEDWKTIKPQKITLDQLPD